MKTILTTKGFDAYLEALAKAGADVDAAAEEALREGGDVLVEGMRRRAPVRTGNLKSKIRARGPFREGGYHYVEVGLPGDTDAETARYGQVMEYGSSSVSAQPFIRPALDEDMRKARAAMRAVFERRGLV